MVATRGITAGSTFATAELRILLLNLTTVMVRQWPTAEPKLYVDDLVIAAAGPSCAHVVQRATDFSVRFFTAVALEVSQTKSGAVASTARVARRVVGGVTKVRLLRWRAAKLLGTAHAGGRRRSAQAQRARLHAFAKRIPRVHQFRRAGGRATAYARTAGLPAVLYGVDVVGYADSRLEEARRLFARAVAPPAAGKNADLVLHFAARAGSDADPAIGAHVLPIGMLAQAVWEGWAGRDGVERVLAHAHATAARGWAAVAGPLAAAVASMRRIGWRINATTHILDDLGQSWSMVEDSPASIKDAVKRTVGRWRFQRVCATLPGLDPSDPINASGAAGLPGHGADGVDDAHAHVPTDAGATSLLVDLTVATTPLLAGRRSLGKLADRVPAWSQDSAPWLVSAATGGQWPQARRSAVKKWGASDLCQLCQSERGTLEHRLNCVITRPRGGWYTQCGDEERFLQQLGDTRQRLLRTRGMLSVRISKWPTLEVPRIRWLTSYPDVTSDRAQWFVDGSLLNGKLPPMAATGGAIVVLDGVGSQRTISCAQVALPSKVRTAAAAEAWMLPIVLAMCPRPPPIITDCLSLVATAQAGTARATASSRPLAGVWRRVAAVTDGDVTALVRDRRLVWMPSHSSLAAALTREKSDGSLVTRTQWRANRLCDAHAKLAAASVAPSRADVDLVALAARVTVLQAAVVGVVTQAANNHREVITTRSGQPGVRVARDACRPTRTPQRHYGPRNVLPQPASETACSAAAAAPAACDAAPRSAAAAPRTRSRSPRHPAALASAAARRKRARSSEALSGYQLREALRRRHGDSATRPPSNGFAAHRDAAVRLAADLADAATPAAPPPSVVPVPLTVSDAVPTRTSGTSARARPYGPPRPPGATAPPRCPPKAGAASGDLASLVRAHTRAYRPPKAAPSARPAMRVPPRRHPNG